MPRKGTLRTWHDNRGFGFIAPSDGGRELFVHISAFPRDGIRPIVGESLSFEVGPGKDGKPQAIRIQRRDLVHSSHSRPSRKVKSESKRSRSVIIVVVLVVALGALGSFMYQEAPNETAEPQAASQYRCDGRRHCSEMTSCEEAKFFLANCPGTAMDGDNDGIPCEQQWCTSR